MKNDLELRPYKKVIEPLIKRSTGKNLHIRFEPIFEKRTLRILFSDEKFFDIDGDYNCQNDRV